MKSRSLTVVFVLAVALPACVAELRAGDVGLELERAKRDYGEGRFADAVRQLRALLPALERERNQRARATRLVDAYCHLGLAYAALDDATTAKDAFRNVLQLDPGRRLDPEVYSPKVVALFEQARLAVSALEPPLSSGTDPGRVPRRSWNAELEGGVQTVRRVHLGGAPGPTFWSPNERQLYRASFYLLPLRSEAGGSGGFLRAGLARHGSASRFELRYAWASASDATAVPLRTELRQTLSPPAPDGSEDLSVRWLDAVWSRRLTQRRRLSVRLELGYRCVRTRQTARDLLRESRCTGIYGLGCDYTPCPASGIGQLSDSCPHPLKPVRYVRRELIRRAARFDDHGLRAGLDLDVALRPAWHLVARGAVTTAVRRETSRVDWEYQNNPEPTSSLWRLGTDYSAAGERHLAYELSAGLRVDLGRRASLRAAYQLEDFGPEGRAAPTGRIRVGGLWLTLACSLGH